MKGAANIHVFFRPCCTFSPVFPSLFLSLCVLAFSIAPAPAAVWHVRPSRHRRRVGLGQRVCGSRGGSEERPAGGDEILAAEGVYVPAFDRNGNPVNGAARTFALKSGVKLLGGFPAEGSPSLQDRDPRTFPTVLTGDLFSDDQVDAEEVKRSLWGRTPITWCMLPGWTKRRCSTALLFLEAGRTARVKTPWGAGCTA